jgi:hypothetical protein
MGFRDLATAVKYQVLSIRTSGSIFMSAFLFLNLKSYPLFTIKRIFTVNISFFTLQFLS